MGEQTGQPEYRRVMADLRNQIANDDIAVGSPIPSTAELTETYNVSVTVVRRAIAELKAEGLLRGQPGKAVYVQAKPVEGEGEPSPEYVALMGEIRAMRSEIERLAQRLDSLEAAADRD